MASPSCPKYQGTRQRNHCFILRIMPCFLSRVVDHRMSTDSNFRYANQLCIVYIKSQMKKGDTHIEQIGILTGRKREGDFRRLQIKWATRFHKILDIIYTYIFLICFSYLVYEPLKMYIISSIRNSSLFDSSLAIIALIPLSLEFNTKQT